MLDTKHLMLLVKASISTIRKLGDKLETRDESCITLCDLVDEPALDVGGRLGKDLSLLERDTDTKVLAGADDSGDACVAAAVCVVSSQLR